MSKKKENLVKLKCTECGAILNFTYRNKKAIKEKLELNKYCSKCRKHTLHKETKK